MDRGPTFFAAGAVTKTNTNGGRTGLRRAGRVDATGTLEAVAEGSSAQSRGRGRRREERGIAVGYIDQGRDAGWAGLGPNRTRKDG